MDSSARACVAYVAARVVTGRKVPHIYDYSRSKYVSIDGSISGPEVQVYDYDRSCHFSGTLPSLYDYGRSSHVKVEIEGDKFSGYDYGSSQHFSGSVRDGSVSFYDYGEGAYFSYSI